MTGVLKFRGTKTPLEVFTECQSVLDPNCDRDTWVKVLMAAKAGDDSPAMEATVRAWSAGGASFNDRDFSAAWRSITPAGGIGFGTLVKMAQDAGWRSDSMESRQPGSFTKWGVGEAPSAAQEQGGSTSDHSAGQSPPSRAEGKAQGEAKTKFWPTADEALRVFGQLLLARCDPAARRLFREDYGLDLESLPDSWRMLELPGRGWGVAYAGEQLDGELCIKWKSLTRNAKNKRTCQFLFRAGGALLLRGAASRREIEAEIERTGAQILMIDSLYMSFAGLDENSADEMTLALDSLGELANRFGVAIILTHHFNKSGSSARGSSVYQGWGESDLSISRLEKEPDVVKVEALMRCAFPKGFPAYWRKPGEATAWFELMPEEWAPAGKGGRPPSVGPAIVPMILKAEGRSLRWKELHAKIMESGNVKASRADELISEAKKLGLVLAAAGVYAQPLNQPHKPGEVVGAGK